MTAPKKHPDDVRTPLLVRMSPREKAALQRRAKREGVTVSVLIRQVLAQNLGRAWPKEKQL